MQSLPHFKLGYCFTALLGGLMLLSACAPGAAPQRTTTPSATPQHTTTPKAGAEFDQLFIDMMTPHHQAALEMATLAQARAEHAELQQMAGEIIEAQSQEIEQLKTWRQQWYGSSDTPPMSAMPMLPGMRPMASDDMMASDMMAIDMTADIETLRNTSQPFDRLFIDLMINHHQMAVDAGRLAVQQATRKEIQDLGQQIIETQQAEIDQLKDWRLAWYGSAEPEATPMP